MARFSDRRDQVLPNGTQWILPHRDDHPERTKRAECNGDRRVNAPGFFPILWAKGMTLHRPVAVHRGDRWRVRSHRNKKFPRAAFSCVPTYIGNACLRHPLGGHLPCPAASIEQSNRQRRRSLVIAFVWKRRKNDARNSRRGRYKKKEREMKRRKYYVPTISAEAMAQSSSWSADPFLPGEAEGYTCTRLHVQWCVINARLSVEFC